MFEPVYVFVYGTLKKRYGNHSVLGNSKFISEGTTVDGEFIMYDGGYPIVVDGINHLDSNGGHIVGEIYLVEEENILKDLDLLEGVPYLYVRKEVEVEEGYNTYNCIMYVASENTANSMRRVIPISPLEGELEWSK